jgi:hypothetical protein
MKFLALIIVLLICIAGTAQVSRRNLSAHYAKQMAVCGGIDSIMSRKGTWKKPYEDDNIFSDKTSSLKQHKNIYARIDSAFLLIKQSFGNLQGFEPRWHRSIRGNSYLQDGPVPYATEALFFGFYCNTNINKILLQGETSTAVKIHFNKLPYFFQKIGNWQIEDTGKLRTVYRLPTSVGEWKGERMFFSDIFDQGPTRVHTKIVVLGRNGKKPWRTLTRKQYLTGLKNDADKMIAAGDGGKVFNAGAYKERLHYITQYLDTASTATLEQPAIIDPSVGIWGFKGKFGSEKEGGFRLAQSALNRNYFDTSLPRHVPQLIQILWKYDPDDPVAQHVIRQFEDEFPLEKLKAMIDN